MNLLSRYKGFTTATASDATTDLYERYAYTASTSSSDLDIASAYGWNPTILESRHREYPSYRAPEPAMDMEAMVDQMWKRMFEQPVIIPCPYCKSHNAFTNPSCISCGAPLGEAVYRFKVEVKST